MRNLRRDLTWIGLAYVAYLVVSALSQTGTAMITSWLVPWIGQDAWMVLCIIFMYPLAFFLYWLILQTVPKARQTWTCPMGAGHFLGWFVICMGGVYFGSLIGQFLMTIVSVITGETMVNQVEEMIMDMSLWAVILSAVILAPIIYGAAIAYLLTPIVNFLERKIIFPIFEKRHKTLQKKGRKVVRWICVILSVFFMFLIIYALVMMILPQLIRSIMNIIYSFPHYVNVVENWLNSVVEKGWKLNPDMISQINQYSSRLQEYLTNTILPQMQSMMKNISASFLDLLVFLKNFLIGAIVSLYILADKEGFVAKAKMATYAVLPAKWATFLVHSMRFTHKTFGGFISGKILDSAIIVLCGNIHHWNAICDSGQCDRWRDKRYPVFWTISWSDSVYSSYFAGRSDSESVFPDLYSGSSAV